MREAAFVKTNHDRWEEFERLVEDSRPDPDKLAELFIQVTDDLSFARTQYPESKTTRYLNGLASKIHLEIYKNKREDKNRFVSFWKLEAPLIVAEAHPKILYAFLLFTVAILIGIISQQQDPEFVRSILGDGYVNMTLENIEEGNALAVYAKSEQTDMFFRITLNNVLVSFRAFAFGLFISVGTGLVLFFNGIMVGVFFTFLAQQDYLEDALGIVMLHGTMELSAIVIAGGAGFVLGNSILFPGTYSRLESLKRGAIIGLKIIVALIPVFIMAGFIESFITRYTGMHIILKLLVIIPSAAFIIYYYIIYPIKLKRDAVREAYGITSGAAVRTED